MPHEDIFVKNLRQFLSKHSCFSEKCEVVYLFVEIRKVLEAENGYKELRFFCNWVIHRRLDQERTTRLLSDLLSPSVDLSKSGRDNARSLIRLHKDLFSQNYLKKYIKKFLEDHDLPTEIVSNGWNGFSKLFLEIVSSHSIDFPKNVLINLKIKKEGDVYGFHLKLLGTREVPVIKWKI